MAVTVGFHAAHFALKKCQKKGDNVTSRCTSPGVMFYRFQLQKPSSFHFVTPSWCWNACIPLWFPWVHGVCRKKWFIYDLTGIFCLCTRQHLNGVQFSTQELINLIFINITGIRGTCFHWRKNLIICHLSTDEIQNFMNIFQSTSCTGTVLKRQPWSPYLSITMIRSQRKPPT